jgi:multicomponent Na+:H+ antiporter subunit C
VAYRNRAEAPDPVPHAMVLTGIVVAVSATAFALSLVRRLHARTGRVTLDDESEPDA